MADGFSLFPYVLVRLNRLPFRDVRGLRASASLQVSQADGYTRRFERLTQSLSDRIFSAVTRAAERRHRAALLALRRDVHNARRLAPGPLRTAADVLTPEESQLLEAYVEIWHRRQDRDRLREESFRLERGAATAKLFHLAKDAGFRRALAFSSHALFADLSRHERVNGATAANSRSLEQGLLRYVSRAHTKTSPFSTFTSVGVAALGDRSGPTPVAESAAQPPAVEFSSSTVVRLNSRICSYLQGLLTLHVAVVSRLEVRLNPTIRGTGGGYSFLTNEGQVSVFQRLETGAAIEYVHQRLSARPLPVGELADALAVVADTSLETSTAFVRKLVSVGFLIFAFPATPLDPEWAAKLLGFLHGLPDELTAAAPLADALSALDAARARLATAPPAACAETMSQCWQQLRSACWTFLSDAGVPTDTAEPPDDAAEPADESSAGESLAADSAYYYKTSPAFRFRAEALFFEDSAARRIAHLPLTPIKKLASTLRSFYECIGVFSSAMDERARMAHHLAERFGGRPTPFLEFFESYCRDVVLPMKREAHRQATGERGVAGDYAEPPVVAARRARRNEWLAGFRSLIEQQIDQEEVQLEVSSLAALNERAGFGPSDFMRAGAHAAFIQLWQTGVGASPELRCVLNGFWPGHGRAFSRFLHLFDPAMTDAVRAWNEASQDGHVWVENFDGFVHNANIHPPLLPFSLSTPETHAAGTWQRGAELPLTDLAIAHADAVSDVELRQSSTGNRVFCIDLGFVTAEVRSQLFKTLQAFAPSDLVGTASLLAVLRDSARKAATRPEAVRLPRLVLDGRVILQRSTWVLDPAHVPVAQGPSATLSSFAEVNAWRERLGIPQEVFLTLDMPRALKQRPQRSRRPSDDHKPQYLAFDSPHFVELLAAVARRATMPLLLTEVLPRPEQQLPVFAGHACELMIEWCAGDITPDLAAEV